MHSENLIKKLNNLDKTRLQDRYLSKDYSSYTI